jgi:alkylated DNA repair dioxygenase AlkB
LFRKYHSERLNELFPIRANLPDGFSYHEDFLSREEEQRLYDIISSIKLHTFIFQGFEARRRVASFGYDYSFDKRRLTKGTDIPQNLEWLVNRVAHRIGVSPTAIAELLITQYPVGSVINWHRDAPPFDVIVGISLMADCMFKLRPHDKNKQSRQSIVSLPVARRSIYVMSGLSREEWQHATAPVKEVRYSITLRTLK